MRRGGLFALVLALAGCADKPAPRPIDDPPAVIPPPPAPPVDDGSIPPPRPLLREPEPGDTTLALEGRKLYLKLKCAGCHSAERANGPLLEGLYGSKVTLKDGGTELADDGYIVDSIRKPRAKVTQGWEPIMPAYDSSEVPAEDLSKLVAYIRSMKKGGAKGEVFPAPNGPPK